MKLWVPHVSFSFWSIVFSWKQKSRSLSPFSHLMLCHLSVPTTSIVPVLSCISYTVVFLFTFFCNRNATFSFWSHSSDFHISEEAPGGTGNPRHKKAIIGTNKHRALARSCQRTFLLLSCFCIFFPFLVLDIFYLAILAQWVFFLFSTASPQGKRWFLKTTGIRGRNRSSGGLL